MNSSASSTTICTSGPGMTASTQPGRTSIDAISATTARSQSARRVTRPTTPASASARYRRSSIGSVHSEPLTAWGNGLPANAPGRPRACPPPGRAPEVVAGLRMGEERRRGQVRRQRRERDRPERGRDERRIDPQHARDDELVEPLARDPALRDQKPRDDEEHLDAERAEVELRRGLPQRLVGPAAGQRVAVEQDHRKSPRRTAATGCCCRGPR